MAMRNSSCCRSETLKMVVLNHYLPKTLEIIFKNSIWFPKYLIATMVYNFFHLLPKMQIPLFPTLIKTIQFLLAVVSGSKKRAHKLNSNEEKINATFAHLRRLRNGERITWQWGLRWRSFFPFGYALLVAYVQNKVHQVIFILVIFAFLRNILQVYCDYHVSYIEPSPDPSATKACTRSGIHPQSTLPLFHPDWGFQGNSDLL